MGETMQAKQILLKGGVTLNQRTVVVEANYIKIIGVNGKAEFLVPWDSILQIML